MPTPTNMFIHEQVLTSDQTSINITNIPQTYRDLLLIVTIPITSAGNPRFRWNGDTGSNYYLTYIDGYGSSYAGGSDVANPSNSLSYTPYNGNQMMIVRQHIFDYSSTDKNKTSIIRSGSAEGNTSAYHTRWASNSAITSIELFNVTFPAGTTIRLSGVHG